MKIVPRLFVALFAAANLATSAEAPVFRTFDIGAADASNAVTVVSAILGPDGKVFFDASSRRLMVLAPSNRLDQVAAAVRDINVPARNVMIKVAYRGKGRTTEQDASVSGGGAVVIGPDGTRGAVRLQPHLKDSSTTVTSSTAQQITVSSGRQASIFVGESVPYLDWIMDYGLRCGAVSQRVSWQQVGATLAVEPFVLGDGPAIRVRLTPELSGLVNGNPYRTRFTTVATEVIVNDGVPFSLGGLNQNSDFYSRFLVGVSRSGARESLDIELTAHIVSPEGISPVGAFFRATSPDDSRSRPNGRRSTPPALDP